PPKRSPRPPLSPRSSNPSGKKRRRKNNPDCGPARLTRVVTHRIVIQPTEVRIRRWIGRVESGRLAPVPIRSDRPGAPALAAMKIVVGLGQPRRQYPETPRHNRLRPIEPAAHSG